MLTLDGLIELERVSANNHNPTDPLVRLLDRSDVSVRYYFVQFLVHLIFQSERIGDWLHIQLVIIISCRC